jgi:hypothetical protein
MIDEEHHHGGVFVRPTPDFKNLEANSEKHVAPDCCDLPNEGAAPAREENLGYDLYTFLMEPSGPHFSDFLTVSETMLDGYARFIDLGLPGHTIALAMLGGAINLYAMFDMRADLPGLLRSVADRIEDGSEPH